MVTPSPRACMSMKSGMVDLPIGAGAAAGGAGADLDRSIRAVAATGSVPTTHPTTHPALDRRRTVVLTHPVDQDVVAAAVKNVPFGEVRNGCHESPGLAARRLPAGWS